MKQVFSAILILLSVFITNNGNGKCEDKKLAKACKPNMKPYKYDAYAVNEIKFGPKERKVDIQFTVYEGQDYKLLFCTSGFQEEIKLNIYDKSRAVKSRKKLYDSSESIDNKFWSFEPKKTGTYYIEYDVPPANDLKPRTECVVILIGFK